MSESDDGRGLKTPTSPGFATPASNSEGKLPEHIPLIPELYYVPHHLVEAEKNNNHSQAQIANDNLPLVRANSLHTLGNLIYENLLSVAEIDADSTLAKLSPTTLSSKSCSWQRTPIFSACSTYTVWRPRLWICRESRQ